MFVCLKEETNRLICQSKLGLEGLDVGVEVAVEGVGGQGGDVADDYKFHACAGHGHVHAPEVAKETYVAVVVAPYEGNEYHVALLALKTVDGVYGDLPAEWLEEGCARNKPPEIMHLRTVWRNHSYVDALFEKTLAADAFYVVLKCQQGENGLVFVEAPVAFSGHGLSE